MPRIPLALEAGDARPVGEGSCNVTAAPCSSSSSVTETINGSHNFTIGGYSLAKGMGAGKFLTSDAFWVGGYQWAIYFYPDGKNVEDNCLYVSIFIALASEGTDVRALFELTLLDQSGKGKHKVHSHFDRSLESGPYTLKYRGSMWGYKRFLRRTVLETSDYLKNDSLSVTCTVGVVVSATQGPKCYKINVPEPDIGLHFEKLLISEEGADVVFDVKGQMFKAHKLVLAARSPVLSSELVSLEGSDNVVIIKDMEPHVFQALLHFIYSDSLVESTSTELAESPMTTIVQYLLAAADRYALDRLKTLCESRICEDVGVQTVAATLALAEQHHCSQLKAVCLKFAAANLAAVMMSEGYEQLQKNCPSLQSELLEAVAEVDEDAGVGIPSVVNRRTIMWLPDSDGSDANGRRVRQRA
ncbi:hypothetical protein KP509_01G026900 [Ceratopteris richardii]|uniref:Uncharacterized protein n=1 Tax=Ceratopteris richardii TaxID=49495 RepID=A0A8T2VJP6_CERRI|nr:hypothetical protein KP509_01G026900 [Ceratopteris richardii]